MTRYFKNVTTAEELKKQYFRLAKQYHPDKADGNADIMKEINNEYEQLFRRYKDVHQNTRSDVDGETYTAKQATAESAADFINIISLLLKLGGLEVELCGRWLWIGGNTKEHKDALKALGCKWSSKKKLWSWHYPEDTPHYRKKKTVEMSEIRERYGSQKFRSKNEIVA